MKSHKTKAKLLIFFFNLPIKILLIDRKMERWLSASKKSHKRGKKLKEIHHNITIKLWLVIKVNWDTAYLSLGIVAVDKESLIVLSCSVGIKHHLHPPKASLIPHLLGGFCQRWLISYFWSWGYLTGDGVCLLHCCSLTVAQNNV